MRVALPDVPHVAVFDTAFHARPAGRGARPTRCPAHGGSGGACAATASTGCRWSGPSSGRPACWAAPPGAPAGRVPSRRGRVRDRRARRPLGRHQHGLQPARGAGDGDPVGLGRPRYARCTSCCAAACPRPRSRTPSTTRAACSPWPGARTCARSRRRPARGDPRARAALDVHDHRLAAVVAGMAAALGGLDALVFTGGVGEGSARVRAAAAVPPRLPRRRASTTATNADGRRRRGHLGAGGPTCGPSWCTSREDIVIARACARAVAGLEGDRP